MTDLLLSDVPARADFRTGRRNVSEGCLVQLSDVFNEPTNYVVQCLPRIELMDSRVCFTCADNRILMVDTFIQPS